MRRIVWFGNCQILALCALYRRYVSKITLDQCVYVPSYTALNPDQSRAIAECDLLLYQICDFAPKSNVATGPRRAQMIPVPMVSGAFLWPFGLQPHPLNADCLELPGGPYPAELGDGFLNKAILSKMPAAEALQAYLKADIVKLKNLNRLYELVVDGQQYRDQRTGFHLADLIAGHFREEQLFLTPFHPGRRIVVALALETFAKIGVDSSLIDRMRRSVVVSPLAPTELPVHPAVAQHFALVWAHSNRKYHFMSEGSFLFTEWSMRYLRFEWNPELHFGIQEARNGSLEIAHSNLLTGLAKSPFSIEGLCELSRVLEKRGAHEQAVCYARRAVDYASGDDVNARLRLGEAFLSAGLYSEAANQARLLDGADTENPSSPDFLLSRSLAFLKDAEAASNAGRLALLLDPHNPHINAHLGNLMAQRGDNSEAEALFRRTLEFAPSNPYAYLSLARLLEHGGRIDESLAVLARGVGLCEEDGKLLTAETERIKERTSKAA